MIVTLSFRNPYVSQIWNGFAWNLNNGFALVWGTLGGGEG